MVALPVFHELSWYTLFSQEPGTHHQHSLEGPLFNLFVGGGWQGRLENQYIREHSLPPTQQPTASSQEQEQKQPVSGSSVYTKLLLLAIK